MEELASAVVTHTSAMSLLEESFEVDTPPAPLPASPPAPIQTYSLAKEVGGIETELVIQTFDDRIFVVVTQSGKVGCLVSLRTPSSHKCSS